MILKQVTILLSFKGRLLSMLTIILLTGCAQNYAYVDMSLPSNEKRLFLSDGSSYYVAHGINSGDGIYAVHFSNEIDSHMTSLGIVRTAETYRGRHGASMRLDGLQTSNSNDRKRDIVLHGADYVNAAYIKQHGQAGHSFGCLAVGNDVIKELLNKLKSGTLIKVFFKR